MTVAFVQAVLVMILLGYLVLDLMLPSKSLSRWLAWSLAPIVGAGVSSLILFSFRRPMFTVEYLLLFALAFVWVWKRRSSLPNFAQFTTHQFSLLGVLLAGALSLVLALSIERTGHIPHGGTDAFAIW